VVFDLFFEEKIYEIWTYVIFLLCKFALKKINLEKCLRVNFEQS